MGISMTTITSETALPPVRPFYQTSERRDERRQMIGVVQYRAAEEGVKIADGVVTVTVPSPGNSVTECWPAESGTITSGVHGDVHWSHDQENLFAALSIPDSGALGEKVRQAYAALLTTTADLGFPQIYRVWNYIGKINDSNDAGLERYRDFCRGRADAFSDLAWAPHALPSGTGIGFAEGGITVFLLARRTSDAANVENPLQMPAYEYPDTYGPRSPSFARATSVTAVGAPSLYISGTASIRGHRTIGNTLEEQIQVTMENIDALLASSDGDPVRFETLKIYVRHQEDMDTVATAFRDRYKVTAHAAPVLRADICRSDLLLEVEGVASRNDGPRP